MSPNFRDNVQSLFLLPLLEQHDRENFEIYLEQFTMNGFKHLARVVGDAYSERLPVVAVKRG